MHLNQIRQNLETRQIWIYFAAVAAATALSWQGPPMAVLERLINPALAFMLYVTFLQLPLRSLGRALGQFRFMLVLLLANFLLVPALVFVLLPLVPDDPVLRLGVLLVLLAPCIDYVVTFAHLGRADARALLACTPVLLFAQMLLLPMYLTAYLGPDMAIYIQATPFLDALIWLILVPLVLAALTQWLAARNRIGLGVSRGLGLAPVPAMALVLFLVVAAVAPGLGVAGKAVVAVLPVYILFAIGAPLLGWGLARSARLDAAASRAVAFSSATRNSLVILPLALAVPVTTPVLPAVIVTQTLVELLAEMIYVRVLGAAGRQS
ncbi:arsenic resistance protein [Alcaligenes sp. SDU_A2]|uniref:arsenic resistance protein n=1 Tax=Alcaligenes sp. SDU_A2 TaxID=3136634 RepID=UPI00311DE3CC